MTRCSQNATDVFRWAALWSEKTKTPLTSFFLLTHCKREISLRITSPRPHSSHGHPIKSTHTQYTQAQLLPGYFRIIVLTYDKYSPPSTCFMVRISSVIKNKVQLLIIRTNTPLTFEFISWICIGYGKLVLITEADALKARLDGIKGQRGERATGSLACRFSSFSLSSSD